MNYRAPDDVLDDFTQYGDLPNMVQEEHQSHDIMSQKPLELNPSTSWTSKGYSRPQVGLGSWLLFPLLSILALGRSSQIITCKIVFFCNKFFFNILNTQVLSHSARQTRLL
jgi:hypothetical protein